MKKIVRDVVCKMPLEKEHAKETLVYAEQSYYFCSIGCRAEFERHPEDYAPPTQSKDEEKDNV
ncbi:MAG TPA: YHS domain-containing protein [Pyrinomonadaceae bacterium]|nr:YHS domain-containing protein [Pyrinomonadaceae bacterium]